MRNSLRKIEGVRDVEVDLDGEKAWVVIAEKVDTSSLIAATTNIGFPSALHVEED